MPILSSIETRRPTQDEFGALAHEVMRHVFEIHADFGRFFDEAVYKRELASRMKGVVLEVPVDVVHETFSKRYFADVIVNGCGLFEFKAAEAIHSRHRGQTIHYLRLFDLPHGKIVNMRLEKVEHEFVNCHRRVQNLRAPFVVDDAWVAQTAGAAIFRDTLMTLIYDWGAGLDLGLYEEALEYFLGKDSPAHVAIPVFSASGHLADQSMRMAAKNVAFKVTALSRHQEGFATHARKLIRHTPLEAILWANITHENVTFATIR